MEVKISNIRLTNLALIVNVETQSYACILY